MAGKAQRTEHSERDGEPPAGTERERAADSRIIRLGQRSIPALRHR